MASPEPIEGRTSALRAAREAAGLGLREAAERAGIDPAHLSRVERGTKQLSVDALYRLAGVLGLGELRQALRTYVAGEGVLCGQP